MIKLSQNFNWPANEWARANESNGLGWSIEKKTAIKALANEIGTSSLFIVQKGLVVHTVGPADKKYEMNSIRKSLLNSLFGVLESTGKLNLSLTLANLNIDDHPNALIQSEKQASLLELMSARSGVYIEPVSETTNMKKLRPARNSHQHGTHFYYNNWSFNVLVSIYEQISGQKIFESFNELIAKPLGLQDYSVSDGEYYRNERSIHPGYFFQMSVRDLARVGMLFLRNGQWNHQKIFKPEWVQKSITAYSDVKEEGGYGLCWWTEIEGRLLPDIKVPSGTYMALGFGGQFMLIVPSLDLIVVHAADTESGMEVTSENFAKLVTTVLTENDLID